MQRLSLNDYAVRLCEALRCYAFPAVTFDFRRYPGGPDPANPVTGRRHLGSMQAVEECIGGLLRSSDLCDVRDGLSNVVYWGWAQRSPGFQRRKVLAFRDHATGDQLEEFRKLVPRMLDAPLRAGEHLHALVRSPLPLPHFSQASFATKILMFLKPDSHPVLDLRIARAFAKCTEFQPLQGLTFGTSISITTKNANCYERWAHWCRRIADQVNSSPSSPCHDLRAVDVERALFTLADWWLDDRARILLCAPGE